MILGFSSTNFAVDSERQVYTLCGNSVAITSIDGTSLDWQPDQGLYEITGIAIAPNSGIVCLSRKCLFVPLLFFRVTKMRKAGEIPAIAQIEVQQLAFSRDEAVLVVLCNYPSSTVKVLNLSTVSGTFALSRTLNLQDSFYNGLIFGKLPSTCYNVIVWNEHKVLAYTLKDENAYTQLACHDNFNDTITCGSITHIGALFGYSSGKICLLNEIGDTLTVVAFCRFAVSCIAADSCLSNILVCQADGFLLQLSTSAPNYRIQLCCRLPSIGRNMFIFPPAQSTGTFSDLIVSTDLGVYRCIEEDNDWSILPIRQRQQNPIRKCHALKSSQCVVCVSANGAFSTLLLHENKVYEWSDPTLETDYEAVDSCISAAEKLVLVSQYAIFYRDPLNGNTLDCVPISSADKTCLKCTINDFGTLICFTADSVYFFSSSETKLHARGFLNLHTLEFALIINAICGVPGEDAFLVACVNGEVFQLSAPPQTSLTETEHSAAVLLKGSWRLDFPVEAMHICYAADEVINILVHSIDKDTKVYALGRRNEEKDSAKVLRPLFLMRDHSSGGCCLSPVGSTVVCSGGKDGCLVWREIEAYQKRLPAVPPSKEKRRPLRESTVWHFAGGGITSNCAVGDMIACAGSQTALLKVAPGVTPIALAAGTTWKEPQWVSRHIGLLPRSISETDASLLVPNDTEERAQAEVEKAQKAIRDDLKEIRRAWKDLVRQEWFDRVSVGSLLPQSQRAQFESVCADSVYEARVSEYYQILENEHTQDVIKERCCAPMEVMRSKIVSINGGLEVHNFHIAKVSRLNQKLAEKCVFLRKLQQKAARGYRIVQNCESVSQKPQLAKNELLASQEELVSALRSPFDAYTQGRSVLQTILFRGVMLGLKDSFNQRYDELRQRKRSILSAIEEKAHRCLQIAKQLNEDPFVELFTPYVDFEEGPDTIFTVRDEELDEKVRHLIPPRQGVCIVSPSNEAALKLWMDGLEKDVERLQVDVPLPSFADESSSAFVPKEERTEEQLQLMEQYEKELREKTEAVNARKDELRGELKRLQTESRELAADFDERLKAMRSLRTATAIALHEIELELVLLLQHQLCFFDACNKFHALQKQIASSFQHMERLFFLIETKKKDVAAMRSTIEEMERMQESFSSAVRHCEPFVDAFYGERLYRRFGRWKRLFEAGKGDVPLSDRLPEGIPPELWSAFCDHCMEVSRLRVRTQESQAPYQQELGSLDALKKELEALGQSTQALENERDHLFSDLLGNFLNTRCLYHLHQGQAQDEKATLVSDFNTSCLRWVSDVDHYNQAILDSAEKNNQLLIKIVQKGQLEKDRIFETKRLDYCAVTLKLELRQLHTLRVTRLMQEWLAGDADVSEEKAVAKINNHIQLVSRSMKRKTDQLDLSIKHLRRQITGRVTENSFVDTERGKLWRTVQDATTVKNMTDAHIDVPNQIATRAREIFQTSEMEELARSQQDELVRLKQEVDRLRSRTFPSFATVCKRP